MSRREPGYGEFRVGPDGVELPGTPDVRYAYRSDPELDAWIAEHPVQLVGVVTAGARRRPRRLAARALGALFARRRR